MISNNHRTLQKTMSTSCSVILFILFTFFGFILKPADAMGQVNCVGGVPTYTVDLTGDPAGTYISPQLIRQGNCCGTSSPDRCLRFDIVLDTGAAAVSFSIASGAVPPGALFYQIDCGTQTQVGDLSCLIGSGVLTFCKPGNNVNTYQVTSIPKPRFPNDDSVRVGCSKPLRLLGFRDDSVRINSVFPGAVGQYNSFLSCASGCSTPIFTPSAGAPAFIDYVICGYPIADQCGFNVTLCDTVRVYIFPELDVTVSPNPGSFCPNSSGVTLTATPSGGVGSYSYTWLNGTTVVGSSNTYFATSAGTYNVRVNDGLASFCPLDSANVSVNVANVVAGAIATNLTCFNAGDGAAVSSVSGGTLPYTYSWSNGATTANISNVQAGTYTVTATDAGGCTSSATVNVTEPPDFTITLVTLVNVGCNGESSGSVDVDVNGGTLPYSYLWSNGSTTQDLSLIPAGTYNLTATDSNGCQDTFSVTVTQPGVLDPLITGTSFTVTNISCKGASDGSATVNVTGGTLPYTYLWSNSATTQTVTGQPAGPLEVVIIDGNGCSAVTNITLTEPDSLLTNINSTSVFLGLYNVSCNGATDAEIDLGVTGGTPGYTYSWSNGGTSQDLTNIPAGVYNVTVTDTNGCTSTETVTLTEPDPLLTSITSPLTPNGTNIGCKGESTGIIFSNVIGGTEPYTFSWSTGSNDTLIAGLPVGFYQLDITDANGCTSTDTITLTEPDTLVPLISSATINGFNIGCYGDSTGTAWVDVVGGSAPYTFQWNSGSVNDSIFNQPSGTIWVIVRDLNSCSAADTAFLNQPDELQAIVSVNSNVSCNGESDGSADVTPIDGTPGYTYSWSNGSTSSALTNVSAGIYYVTVEDANGCTYLDSVEISEPAVLSATPVPFVYPSGHNISCNGASNGSIDLTVSGGTQPYSFNWSNGDTTQNIADLPAGSYTVTVTDANNCTFQSSVTLSQPTPLSIDTIFSPEIYGGWNVSCNAGTDGAVNITVSGGSPSYTYYWSNGDSTQNISNVSVFIYYVTVTDTNGCIAQDSLWIDEPTPLAVAVGQQQNVDCFGNSTGSVTISASGSTPPYQFSIDGITFQSDSLFDTLQAGTYTITVRDTNGCSTPAVVTITEPTAALSAVVDSVSNIGCNGSATGLVEIGGVGGTAPFEYSLDGVAFQTDSIFSNLAANNYTATVRDVNGCTSTISFGIVQAPLLTGSSSSVNATCGTDNGTASVVMTGGTPPYVYSWTPIGGTTSTITGLAAGTYYVTVSDSLGCLYLDTVQVTATVPVAASLSSQTNNACFGQSIGEATVTAASGTPSYSYQWTPSGGTSATATGLSAGVYTCTVTDADNCTSSVVVTITEPTAVQATVTPDPALCTGTNNGTATVAASGGTGGYTYVWSNGDTGATADSLAPGLVSVVVSDANSCTVNASATVPSAANLTAAVSVASNVSCNGLSDGSAVVTPVTGGAAPYSYAWTNGSTTLSANGLPAGSVSVTITDSSNCQITLSATVTEPLALTVDVTVDGVDCYGGNDGSATATGVNGTAGYTYNWDNGTSTTSVYNNLGEGVYQVVVTDANGCTATASASITQPGQINPTAGSDQSGCQVQFQLDATYGSGNAGLWTVVSGSGVFADDESPNTSVTNLTVGANVFVWTVTQGPCSESDTVVMILNSEGACELDLPTAFSPNGDGFNDGYFIKGIDRYPNNVFRVFNRWGNEVYNKDDYTNSDWIGQNNSGQQLPDGTYFVVLVIADKDIRKGTYVDLRKVK